MSKQFGDFQTPPALVNAILECLGAEGKIWPRVLEPACGCGNFITGLLNLNIPPREIQAIELQNSYIKNAREIADRSSFTRVVIQQSQIFTINFLQDLIWRTKGSLLVVGNPPWVTNSALGAMGSDNLPHKRNLKKLKGLEAVMGSANFDITEYILLKLIQELASEKPTIALLCKLSVARNILQFAFDQKLPIAKASIRLIDAKKWFGAAVGACLFCLDVDSEISNYEAAVYPNLQATQPESIVGIAGGKLVADMKAYQRSAFADGVCPFTWRQGLKHDAASVMELTYNALGSLENKLGEIVSVEAEYIYPLLKSSDIFHQIATPKRTVIVTQKRLSEDTRQLQYMAPKLWRYLNAHAEIFERRKSSIYRGKPPFSMFGIGDYSFALYKVGISGLHKTPKFQAIAPFENRPVMLDDTCYFIACDSLEQAFFLASLLNDPVCLDFIYSRLFTDAKRPIAKKLLQCINLKALFDKVEISSVLFKAETEFEKWKTLTGQPNLIWPLSLEDFLVERLLNHE